MERWRRSSTCDAPARTKARRDREVEADANRRRFGRTKSQKDADKQDEERTRRTLDGKLIDKE